MTQAGNRQVDEVLTNSCLIIGIKGGVWFWSHRVCEYRHGDGCRTSCSPRTASGLCYHGAH